MTQLSQFILGVLKNLSCMLELLNDSLLRALAALWTGLHYLSGPGPSPGDSTLTWMMMLLKSNHSGTRPACICRTDGTDAHQKGYYSSAQNCTCTHQESPSRCTQWNCQNAKVGMPVAQWTLGISLRGLGAATWAVSSVSLRLVALLC